MDERSQPVRPSPASRSEFTRRVLVVVGVVALAVALAAVFVRAADIFFLFFAAVLLANLLRSASDALSRWTGVGPHGALGLVVLALLGLFAAAAYFVGEMVVGQVANLAAELPRSVDQVRAYLHRYPRGEELLRHAPPVRDVLNGGAGDVAARTAAFFSTTFGVLGNLLVLTFLSLYLAASPRTYVSGAVALVPPAGRARAERVLAVIGEHLKWWLLGRLVAIAAVGLVTGVGLWLVGVPQYLVLAPGRRGAVGGPVHRADPGGHSGHPAGPHAGAGDRRVGGRRIRARPGGRKLRRDPTRSTADGEHVAGRDHRVHHPDRRPVSASSA